jgi:hypothetical protein
MNQNKTLNNPLPTDFKDSNDELLESEDIKPSSDQLFFTIDSPSAKLQQVISSVKMDIKKKNEILEISMIWKNPALSFAICTMLIDVLILLVGGILKFNDIRPKIPLFYNAIDQRWDQIDKTIIFIIPLVLVPIELLIIHFTMSIFKQDRRLSITISWVLALLNLLILLIIGQFYTLLLR